jgi:hypothetical protein
MTLSFVSDRVFFPFAIWPIGQFMPWYASWLMILSVSCAQIIVEISPHDCMRGSRYREGNYQGNHVEPRHSIHLCSLPECNIIHRISTKLIYDHHVFLFRDCVVSVNVRIWRDFCVSSKECPYVSLLRVISHASYASLLTYLTSPARCQRSCETL